MERTSVNARLAPTADDAAAFSAIDAAGSDSLLFTLPEEPCPGALQIVPGNDFEPVGIEAIGVEHRALDICLSLLILVLVLPLMAVCALAIRLGSEGPILFRHPRIGLNGEEFDCLKFRTMRVDADRIIAQLIEGSDEHKVEWITVRKLKRDPRVTRIGRFLRRYCLDELPQLFNVLAGEMSLVGPRPIVREEIVRYGPGFAAYCSVKPGLTGLWQVSGRHALSYEERVRLDGEYARSKSVSLDLRLLLRTFPIVIAGQNL